MVHPFAAVGAEAGDYGAERAFGGGGMSASFGADDRLGAFCGRMLAAFGDFTQWAADAEGLVYGGSGASAEATQSESFGTEGVMHGASAGTAGAASRVEFIAGVAVGANVYAIEPRGVEELSRLHVESDSDGIFLALCVGRRTSAVAAAEVESHPLMGNVDESAVEGAVTIVIALMIAVLLRSGESGHGHD